MKKCGQCGETKKLASKTRCASCLERMVAYNKWYYANKRTKDSKQRNAQKKAERNAKLYQRAPPCPECQKPKWRKNLLCYKCKKSREKEK